MIRLMIGRDLKSLYIAARRAARRDRAGDRGRAHRDLSGPHRQPRRPARRDPRPRRPRRLRPHRAGARPLRHRSRCSAAAVRLDGEPIVDRLAARRHRPRHLSRAGGPQALRPAARHSPSPRTSRCPISPPTRAAMLIRTAAGDRRTPSGSGASSTSGRADVAQRGRHRCRAATSRRSCWPNGCR